MNSHEPVPVGSRLSHFVHRRFLWLLIGCYVLSAVWPEPGLAMRGWKLPHLLGSSEPLTLPLLLLALLLFCAAILTNLAQIRSVLQHPGTLVAGLAAVWLGPALLVVVAGPLVPWIADGSATAGLLVGLALVATMPVANSSVGWAQNSNANLALSLGLVVLSISLSPWTTPQLLGLLGLSLSPAERTLCQELVSRFSGTFFIVWVILPTLAGFACRHLIRPHRVEHVRHWIVLASAAALLVLNYVNAALALPKVFDKTPALLATTAALALALSLVGIGMGWVLAWLLRMSDDMRSSLLFGLSMKHTGLALILAGAVLADQPLAILMIVLATLEQHLVAAVVQWWLGRGDREDAATSR